MFCLLEARLWRISSTDELIKFVSFLPHFHRGVARGVAGVGRRAGRHDNTLHVYHNLNQN